MLQLLNLYGRKQIEVRLVAISAYFCRKPKPTFIFRKHSFKGRVVPRYSRQSRRERHWSVLLHTISILYMFFLNIVCSLYFMSVLDSCRLVHISSSILLVFIEMSFILTETDLYLGRIISSNSADRFPNLKTLDSVSVISSYLWDLKLRLSGFDIILAFSQRTNSTEFAAVYAHFLHGVPLLQSLYEIL